MTTDMRQFRADFSAVYAHWGRWGEMSPHAAAQERDLMAKAIQRNIHDEELIALTAAHFRQIAAGIEAEKKYNEEINEMVKKEKYGL